MVTVTAWPETVYEPLHSSVTASPDGKVQPTDHPVIGLEPAVTVTEAWNPPDQLFVRENTAVHVPGAPTVALAVGDAVGDAVWLGVLVGEDDADADGVGDAVADAEAEGVGVGVEPAPPRVVNAVAAVTVLIRPVASSAAISYPYAELEVRPVSVYEVVVELTVATN